MTIREALIDTGIDTLDAYLLLGNLLTQRRSGAADFKIFTKTNLLAMGNEQITEEEYEDFLSLVERRKNGECVAYITGKKEFWGLEFFVSPAVLVPRPETEILVETTIKRSIELRELNELKQIRILDLCTGSGAIAVALKHELPELEVFATDISPEALEVAKKNAEQLLSNNNDITFLQGNLFNISTPCPPCLRELREIKFQLIVSNPPYVSSVEIETLAPEVQNEPRIALDGGSSGLEIIERIIKEAPDYLERGGHLLLEADPRQIKEIKLLLANRGFKDIMIYKDLAGLDRVIGGKFV